MQILITGGTGLIGRALCQHWQRQGHDLFVWSRDPAQVPRLCSGAQGIAQLHALDGSAPLDAVVNLAGAPIADRPWTAARRDLLWRSRVDLTRTLVEIRPVYRFDESCQGTLPESITAFLESTGFEDAIRKAISIGGDSDTIACITGGIAEAYYGIPNDIAQQAYRYLPHEFIEIIEMFNKRYRRD